MSDSRIQIRNIVETRGLNDIEVSDVQNTLTTSYVVVNLRKFRNGREVVGQYKLTIDKLSKLVEPEATNPTLGDSTTSGNTRTISAEGSETNISIVIAPKGAGDVILGNYTLDVDQTLTVLQDKHVLTYDNTTGKASFEQVDYINIANTPALATVATTGDYNDLINIPAFATVAFTGDYNDLINTPSGSNPTGPAGGDLSGTYPNPDIATNAVTTVKILNAAVSSDKLATDAVSTIKIQDLAVTTAKIAGDAITVDQIADDAVENSKIINSSISTDKLINNAVTFEKFQDVTGTTILGRVLAGTGDITALTPEEAAAAIGAVINDGNTSTFNQLKVRTIETGEWDMSALQTLLVPHGFGANWVNIRYITIIVRNDADLARYPLNADIAPTGSTEGTWSLNNTNFILTAFTGGFFDGTDFDSLGGYNRGWITIFYEDTV